jgi:hypothetical protein
MYTYPSVSQYANVPNGQWDIHYTQTNPTMTTSHTKSPQLRVIAGPDTTPTPHKAIQGFFRETEDAIMDNPHTTNSNNTQNKTTPTQPIPKTITENEKAKPTITFRYKLERQLTQNYYSRDTTHSHFLPSQSALTNQ